MVAPSLPVASVLAVGLGKARDEWPADVIRRAAGVAARSLTGTEAVITTLSELDLEATVEGLILGAYRFSDFRSAKTAPKEPGLRKITALTADTKGAKTKTAAERATAIATAVATARDFVNTPPSHLFPPNSPSAQRLWVRRPVSRSRCSTRRRWPRGATAASSASARARRAHRAWSG